MNDIRFKQQEKTKKNEKDIWKKQLRKRVN